MKIAYEDKNLRASVLATITMADQIAAEYTAQGYDLTLRQLYYQFVSRDLIPNNQLAYNNLGNAVNSGRLNGLIDWDHITDRTRNLRGTSHWARPGDVINSASYSYRLDKWATQKVRVEIWVEKEALAGVIQRAANVEDVDWFSCRGYVSQSEMWAAAQRHQGYIEDGQRVVVLHLGDHDPSGIDMTRDIRDRLENFIGRDLARPRWGDVLDADEVQYALEGAVSNFDLTGDPIIVDRIALNMNQIRQYDPPPNPAKFTDSRAVGYVERYGNQSWELDALEPSVLAALIASSIESLRDDTEYLEVAAQERRERSHLAKMARHYDDLVGHLEEMD